MPILHLFEVVECMVAAFNLIDAVNVYCEAWGVYVNPVCQAIANDRQVSIYFDRRPVSSEIPADAHIDSLEYGRFKVTARADAWASLGRQIISIDSDLI